MWDNDGAWLLIVQIRLCTSREEGDAEKHQDKGPYPHASQRGKIYLTILRQPSTHSAWKWAHSSLMRVTISARRWAAQSGNTSRQRSWPGR